MKKSAILWSVLLIVLSVLLIKHALAFFAMPIPFQPNWLTIIPAVGIWAAFVGFVINKKIAVGESRSRKLEAELLAEFVACR